MTRFAFFLRPFNIIIIVINIIIIVIIIIKTTTPNPILNHYQHG